MLNWGVNQKPPLFGANPIEGITPLPHDEKAKVRRPLELDEVQAVFEHSPEYLKPVWRMFMTTGVRKSELVNMTFDEVDFENREATVCAGSAKNHKARTIPLDDDMLATIEALRDKAEHREPVDGSAPQITASQHKHFSRQHVFVTTANTTLRNKLLTKFYAVCKRAGIEDAKAWGAVDIHSLRGTFITHAINGGASPKAVQEIVGHATLDMTMNVNAKATERAKRDAVNSLPFATATAPLHVVELNPKAVQKAHSARTSNSEADQAVVGRVGTG